jgi:hypothetical protein
MQLKKDIITKISGTGISLPAGELFSLPEKSIAVRYRRFVAWVAGLFY